MYYYKNILIISDNEMLTVRARNWLTNRPEIKEVAFTYKKTVANKKVQIGDDAIDLKNPADVLKIISNFDLVISWNCAQKFPEKMVNEIKCINIHPGFNPDTRGCFSEVFSIIYDTKIGATIHEMDAQLDHGPIIAREEVVKEDWDTAFTLYHKIINKEFELMEKHFNDILRNTYSTWWVEEGRIFTKKDFKALQQIDLFEKKSFREFIDHLRAMTFEGFDNCYFINNAGKKVFVSLQLKPGNQEKF